MNGNKKPDKGNLIHTKPKEIKKIGKKYDQCYGQRENRKENHALINRQYL